MDSLIYELSGDAHRVEPRDKVLHTLPGSHPALLRVDRANQVAEVLGRVSVALALRAIRTLLKLPPLLFVEDEAAAGAG